MDLSRLELLPEERVGGAGAVVVAAGEGRETAAVIVSRWAQCAEGFAPYKCCLTPPLLSPLLCRHNGGRL